MIKIIFNEPRGATPEELFRWALETTEKLNRLQSISENYEKEVKKNGIREGQGDD